DDRSSQRPEVGGDVANRAVGGLQVAERADVLRREELQAEAVLRIEFPAAAEHHGKRLRIIRIRSERVHPVADKRHARAALHEEALRRPWPELRAGIDPRRADSAALVAPLHPEQVGPDIQLRVDAAAGIADDGAAMAKGKVLRAVLAVAPE